MKEEWKDIPGFDGRYQASTLGRIRRAKNKNGVPAGKILRPSSKRKYQNVTLYTSSGRVYSTVHRLIARVFIGECPENLEVNHKNGNTHDNRIVNLEYVTKSENMKHAYHVLKTAKMTTKRAKGEGAGSSKLTDKQVLIIRKLYKEGDHSMRALAKMYGITNQNVCRIINRATWRHI